MSQIETQQKTASPARPNPMPARRPSPANAKKGGAGLTSQCIARDIGEFKKAGGRIEVLGNTPVRALTPRAAPRNAAAARKTVAAGKPKGS